MSKAVGIETVLTKEKWVSQYGVFNSGVISHPGTSYTPLTKPLISLEKRTESSDIERREELYNEIESSIGYDVSIEFPAEFCLSHSCLKKPVLCPETYYTSLVGSEHISTTGIIGDYALSIGTLKREYFPMRKPCVVIEVSLTQPFYENMPPEGTQKAGFAQGTQAPVLFNANCIFQECVEYKTTFLLAKPLILPEVMLFYLQVHDKPEDGSTSHTISIFAPLQKPVCGPELETARTTTLKQINLQVKPLILPEGIKTLTSHEKLFEEVVAKDKKKLYTEIEENPGECLIQVDILNENYLEITPQEGILIFPTNKLQSAEAQISLNRTSSFCCLKKPILALQSTSEKQKIIRSLQVLKKACVAPLERAANLIDLSEAIHIKAIDYNYHHEIFTPVRKPKTLLSHDTEARIDARSATVGIAQIEDSLEYSLVDMSNELLSGYTESNRTIYQFTPLIRCICPLQFMQSLIKPSDSFMHSQVLNKPRILPLFEAMEQTVSHELMKEPPCLFRLSENSIEIIGKTMPPDKNIENLISYMIRTKPVVCIETHHSVSRCSFSCKSKASIMPIAYSTEDLLEDPLEDTSKEKVIHYKAFSLLIKPITRLSQQMQTKTTQYETVKKPVLSMLLIKHSKILSIEENSLVEIPCNLKIICSFTPLTRCICLLETIERENTVRHPEYSVLTKPLISPLMKIAKKTISYTHLYKPISHVETQNFPNFYEFTCLFKVITLPLILDESLKRNQIASQTHLLVCKPLILPCEHQNTAKWPSFEFSFNDIAVPALICHSKLYTQFTLMAKPAVLLISMEKSNVIATNMYFAMTKPIVNICALEKARLEETSIEQVIIRSSYSEKDIYQFLPVTPSLYQPEMMGEYSIPVFETKKDFNFLIKPIILPLVELPRTFQNAQSYQVLAKPLCNAQIEFSTTKLIFTCKLKTAVLPIIIHLEGVKYADKSSRNSEEQHPVGRLNEPLLQLENKENAILSHFKLLPRLICPPITEECTPFIVMYTLFAKPILLPIIKLKNPARTITHYNYLSKPRIHLKTHYEIIKSAYFILRKLSVLPILMTNELTRTPTSTINFSPFKKPAIPLLAQGPCSFLAYPLFKKPQIILTETSPTGFSPVLSHHSKMLDIEFGSPFESEQVTPRAFSVVSLPKVLIESYKSSHMESASHSVLVKPVEDIEYDDDDLITLDCNISISSIEEAEQGDYVSDRAIPQLRVICQDNYSPVLLQKQPIVRLTFIALLKPILQILRIHKGQMSSFMRSSDFRILNRPLVEPVRFSDPVLYSKAKDSFSSFKEKQKKNAYSMNCELLFALIEKMANRRKTNCLRMLQLLNPQAIRRKFYGIQKGMKGLVRLMLTNPMNEALDIMKEALYKHLINPNLYQKEVVLIQKAVRKWIVRKKSNRNTSSLKKLSDFALRIRISELYDVVRRVELRKEKEAFGALIVK